jgi:hypothetical protein
MHQLTLRYPEQPNVHEQQALHLLLLLLEHVLPCRFCRESYERFAAAFPMDSACQQGKESVVRWMFDLHRVVNAKLQKSNRFETIDDMQVECTRDCNRSVLFELWYMLFAIAFNYPADAADENIDTKRLWYFMFYVHVPYLFCRLFAEDTEQWFHSIDSAVLTDQASLIDWLYGAVYAPYMRRYHTRDIEWHISREALDRLFHSIRATAH